MGHAITNVAKLRYPWLDSEGDGINNPAAREFIKQQVFHWEECAELVWLVCNKERTYLSYKYITLYSQIVG